MPFMARIQTVFAVRRHVIWYITQTKQLFLLQCLVLSLMSFAESEFAVIFSLELWKNINRSTNVQAQQNKQTILV